MTSALILTICLVAAAAIASLRKEMSALGRTIRLSILKFKAGLKQIDDDLWR